MSNNRVTMYQQLCLVKQLSETDGDDDDDDVNDLPLWQQSDCFPMEEPVHSASIFNLSYNPLYICGVCSTRLSPRTGTCECKLATLFITLPTWELMSVCPGVFRHLFQSHGFLSRSRLHPW